jgi:tetratricopeptide (TPR) repeat protein
MKLTAFAVLISLLALPVSAQTSDEAGCQSETPDLSITACTAAIASGNESAPNLSMLHNNRGAAYANERSYEKATNDYNDAIELDPTNSLAYSNRANLNYLRRYYVAALQDYTRAISLSPDSPGPYDGRAATYLAMGQPNEALSDANEAITLSPTRSGFFETRGEVYEKLEEAAKAAADYHMALSLDPADRSAQEGLRRLNISPLVRRMMGATICTAIATLLGLLIWFAVSAYANRLIFLSSRTTYTVQTISRDRSPILYWLTFLLIYIILGPLLAGLLVVNVRFWFL